MRRLVLLFVSAAVALTSAGRAQEMEFADDATAALPLARVLPAVGSTAGAAGAFFRTSVQIFNPGQTALSGRLVYHASGTSGKTSDPGMDFSIPAQETQSWDDILPAMGQSGLGTLDILLPSASSSPAVIVTRVFNDGDAAGTAGFTEEAISPNETGTGGRVITNGKSAYLVLPADMDRFRFNIGLRTLNSAALVQFTVRDENGAIVGQGSRTMPSSSFLQQEAGSLLGIALPPNGTIRIVINGGGTIVYGATTDNTTNDPSVQFARSS
jgi:hypothetical protein